MNQLERLVPLARETISRHVNALVGGGFLREERTETFPRTRWLALTWKGVDMLRWVEEGRESHVSVK
mgnify:CR=1 FL=1